MQELQVTHTFLGLVVEGLLLGVDSSDDLVHLAAARLYFPVEELDSIEQLFELILEIVYQRSVEVLVLALFEKKSLLLGDCLSYPVLLVLDLLLEERNAFFEEANLLLEVVYLGNQLLPLCPQFHFFHSESLQLILVPPPVLLHILDVHLELLYPYRGVFVIVDGLLQTEDLLVQVLVLLLVFLDDFLQVAVLHQNGLAHLE